MTSWLCHMKIEHNNDANYDANCDANMTSESIGKASGKHPESVREAFGLAEGG